jgi:hypothetical protein
MSAPHHTLTIEYTDAQGQVQRTEHVQGSHFTLRVQTDALHLISAGASTDSASVPSPMPALAQRAWQRITPAVGALMLFVVFSLLWALRIWIEYNPDEGAEGFVTMAFVMMGAIALWSAIWALLGKTFAKHANFWKHVCTVLIAGIVFSVLLSALHFVSFSLSWRTLGRMDTLSYVAAFSLLVWAHLRLIVRAQRSAALRVGMLTFTLVSVALMMWTNHRRSDTVLDTVHSPYLYRPSLQMSSPQTSSSFFEEVKALEATLKSKAVETEPGEDGLGVDED